MMSELITGRSISGLVIIVGLLITACSSPDLPLDSKPVDFQSARNLAETIAHVANCGDFEDYSSDNNISFTFTFTCQRGTPIRANLSRQPPVYT
jgi:hypothetical protein